MAPRLHRAFVDGGCHPNPEGTMGIGVHLEDPDGNTVADLSERPTKLGTNNEAEYIAVLRALQTALDHDIRDLEVLADSKLTVNTLMGRWQVRAANLKPLKAMIDAERPHFRTLRFLWVPREKNKVADRLATEAIGGTVGGTSKYGGGPKLQRKQAAAARSVAEGILCGTCKQVTRLKWQRFKNGTSHLRQECPEHGFLRYVPKHETALHEEAGPPPS